MTEKTFRVIALQPTYLARIAAAFQSGLIPPGTFSDALVAHDDDCPMLAGTGPCTCQPAIELVRADGEKVRVP